jgi:hypothetical protein
MPQLLYTWGKRPQCPVNRRISGPQSWSGCFRKEKLLALARISNPGSNSLLMSHYSGNFINAKWLTVRRMDFTPK